ncbi:hypothetical protein H9P43_009714 [Blastocladiella emersonii ATCC 22665]|nr:hypothetical protein H9P43_009714 [Blastocladiella emersonii ATCC 22665]
MPPLVPPPPPPAGPDAAAQPMSVGSTGTPSAALPDYFPTIGVILAVTSSMLIGLSFVLQKRGMTAAQAKKRAKRSAAAAAAALGVADPAKGASTATLPLPLPPIPRRVPSSSTVDVVDAKPRPRRVSAPTPASDGLHRAGSSQTLSVQQMPGMTPRGSIAAGSKSAKVVVVSEPKRRKRCGPPYLYSHQWWIGTVLMIVGEGANLGAYAFTSAIVVTPLGALSVVVSAVLSSYFLNEHMNLQGKLGCALSIMGATILVLNAPKQVASADMTAFAKAYFAPGFLAWNALALLISLLLIFWFVPRARSNALGYLGACSLLGSLSVVEIQAVATAVVGAVALKEPAAHAPWTDPLFWTVLIKAAVELLTQLFFLNQALARFSTVLVTPLYYGGFTSATLIANWILNPPWSALDAKTVLTCLLAFAVICAGVLLLQTSKITTTTTTVAATAPTAAAVLRNTPSMIEIVIDPASPAPAPAVSGTSTPKPTPLAAAPVDSGALLFAAAGASNASLPVPVLRAAKSSSTLLSSNNQPVEPEPAAPATAAAAVIHHYTREQPWLLSSGHLADWIPALLAALQAESPPVHDSDDEDEDGGDEEVSGNFPASFALARPRSSSWPGPSTSGTTVEMPAPIPPPAPVPQQQPPATRPAMRGHRRRRSTVNGVVADADVPADGARSGLGRALASLVVAASAAAARRPSAETRRDE